MSLGLYVLELLGRRYMKSLSNLSLLSLLAIVSLIPPTFAETIEEKAALCAACHGEKGVPIDTKFPIISGQQQGYLYIQLRDMKSGSRKNEVMAPIVAEMSKEDMLAYAEYFSGKEWPALGYDAKITPSEAAKANEIEVAGQCSTCHRDGYVGDATVPRLAGQSVEYLIKTTHDFKTKERANNTFMNDMLASFKDEDIELMSRFVAGH
jgi:cytochrome c553